MKKLILGEVAVMLFLIIGVDFLPLVICWIPFIAYNILFLRRIVEHINWDNINF